jgi:flagellar biosynthesis/type III secretory pathway protein FliH
MSEKSDVGEPSGRIIRSHGRILEPAVATAAIDAARIRSQAESELAAARAAVEGLRKSAHNAGYAEGYEAGRQAALAESTALVASARLDAEAVRRDIRGGVVAVGRRLAEKIIGKAVSLDETVLADLATQAVDDARVAQGIVLLRVHPEDIAALERQRPALVSRMSAQVVLRIEADASIGRYGCVVQTPTGRVDAQLSTQLDALEKALADAAKRSAR